MGISVMASPNSLAVSVGAVLTCIVAGLGLDAH